MYKEKKINFTINNILKNTKNSQRNKKKRKVIHCTLHVLILKTLTRENNILYNSIFQFNLITLLATEFENY